MELDLAGMHQLAAGQGIDPETLDAALSEALRLAYLKTPHAAKHARVELDPRAGSFTVWAQDEIPGEPTEDDPPPRADSGRGIRRHSARFRPTGRCDRSSGDQPAVPQGRG